MWESFPRDLIVSACSMFIGFIAKSVWQAIVDMRDMRKIYKWMVEESRQPGAKSFRSTKAISRGVCLSLERVADLCGRSKKIHISTGREEGLWTITDRYSRPGFFDSF